MNRAKAREIIEKWMKYCKRNNVFPPDHTDLLIARLVESEPEWVKCSPDTMPEIWDNVLIYCKAYNCMCRAALRDDGSWTECCGYEVTHWRELPAEPEE